MPEVCDYCGSADAVPLGVLCRSCAARPAVASLYAPAVSRSAEWAAWLAYLAARAAARLPLFDGARKASPPRRRTNRTGPERCYGPHAPVAGEGGNHAS